MIVGGIFMIINALNSGKVTVTSDGGALFPMATLLVIVNGIVCLIAGVIGSENAANPHKALNFIVWGSLTTLICILGSVLYIVDGRGFDGINLLTGLILPAIYLIGAFQLMNKT